MEQLDPEMLKNLDLLLDLDVIEEERNWEILENLDVLDVREDGKSSDGREVKQ